ncbi:MAG: alanine dehydrogenase, partial [Dolichospermum sp.]
MEIGVPKETKDQEFRVGLSPSSVRVLRENGHNIFVESQAGNGAGFTDEDYKDAGAEIVDSESAAWDRELVIKVKEPLISEYKFLRKEQLFFTYLHLAANRQLTEYLIDCGICA